MRVKRQHKGSVGIQLFLFLVLVVVGIGLYFAVTSQLSSDTLQPLKDLFMNQVTGSAGGVLHLTTCDYKGSDTEEKVFFCWGWRCAQLNKIGPDFRRGSTGTYNIAMRDKGIEEFFFVLVKDRPGLIETARIELGELSGGVKDKISRREGLGRKAASGTLEALKESRGFSRVIMGPLMSGWKSVTKQCLCIKQWHLDYRGKTIMNVTYKRGYVLAPHEGENTHPITEVVKPKPGLLPKTVTLTGNVKEEDAEDKSIDCIDYKNTTPTLSGVSR